MMLKPRFTLASALLLFSCGDQAKSGKEGVDQQSAGGATAGGTKATAGGGADDTPAAAGASNLAGSLGATGGVAGGSSAVGGTSAGAGNGAASGSGGGSMLPVLDVGLPPGENFDLSRWSITFPDATQELEAWLVAGGERPGEFFTDPETGGMAFRVPNIASATANSTYPRTELREMLRAGNTDIDTRGLGRNNWVFSSSNPESEGLAGGVDGRLGATLKIDRVSVSGEAGKVGRLIVGQIHASENEPCRLYYRKLPGNTRGSLYFAHEPNQGDESFIELVGSREDDAVDPVDGVALGETFGYRIEVAGDNLTVTVVRAGSADVSASVPMGESGFADDWMYFKAGAYNQNNTGADDDYAQATFFSLEVEHD